MPLFFRNGTFEEWIYWYQVNQDGYMLPSGQILAVRLADPVQSCQRCGGTGIYNGWMVNSLATILICRCSVEIRAN